MKKYLVIANICCILFISCGAPISKQEESKPTETLQIQTQSSTIRPTQSSGSKVQVFTGATIENSMVRKGTFE